MSTYLGEAVEELNGLDINTFWKALIIPYFSKKMKHRCLIYLFFYHHGPYYTKHLYTETLDFYPGNSVSVEFWLSEIKRLKERLVYFKLG